MSIGRGVSLSRLSGWSGLRRSLPSVRTLDLLRDRPSCTLETSSLPQWVTVGCPSLDLILYVEGEREKSGRNRTLVGLYSFGDYFQR